MRVKPLAGQAGGSGETWKEPPALELLREADVLAKVASLLVP